MSTCLLNVGFLSVLSFISVAVVIWLADKIYCIYISIFASPLSFLALSTRSDSQLSIDPLVLLTAILGWKASCCQLSLLHHDISIFWWAVLAEQLALLFLLILYLLAKTVSVYIIQILYTYTVIYLKFDLQSYASCERLPMLLITFDLGTFVAYKYNNGHLQ